MAAKARDTHPEIHSLSISNTSNYRCWKRDNLSDELFWILSGFTIWENFQNKLEREMTTYLHTLQVPPFVWQFLHAEQFLHALHVPLAPAQVAQLIAVTKLLLHEEIKTVKTENKMMALKRCIGKRFERWEYDYLSIRLTCKSVVINYLYWFLSSNALFQYYSSNQTDSTLRNSIDSI
jgi:hypothetical protein